MSSHNFVAIVAYKSLKNCMITVPSKWMSLFRNNALHIFEMEFSEKRKAYFSWSGEFSIDNSSSSIVEISGLFALKLGIKEGEQVVMKIVKNLPACKELFAEPIAVDDWEILELNATYIQNNLLDQVRVVWEGQIIPVWIQSSVCLFVKIGRVTPTASAVKLEEFTDVVVSPRLSNSRQTVKKGAVESPVEYVANDNENSWLASSWKTITRIFKDGDSNETRGKPKYLTEDFGFDLDFPNFERRYRVNPYPDLYDIEPCFGGGDNLTTATDRTTFQYLAQPTTVLVGVDSLPEALCDRDLKPFMATISKVTPKNDEEDKSNADGKTVKEEKVQIQKQVQQCSAFVRAVVVDSVFLDGFNNAFSKSGHRCNLGELMVPNAVLVPEVLRRWIGLEISSTVTLKAVNCRPRIPRTITYGRIGHMISGFTADTLELEVRQYLHRTATSHAPLVTSSSTLTELNWKGHRVDVRLSPSRDRSLSPTDPERPQLVFWGPHLKLQPDITGQIETPVSYVDICSKLDAPPVGLRVEALGGFEDHVDTGTLALQFALRLGPLSESFATLTRPPCYGHSLLICGPKGVGKSTLAKCFCRQMLETPYKVHSAVVECISLIGKRVESVVGTLKGVFNEEMRRAPSIVVLDDLDQLIRASNGAEMPSDNNARLAHAFLELMDSLPPEVPLTVIATSASRATLCPLLVPSSGKRVFFKTLDIKPPSIARRGLILKSLLMSKTRIHRDSLERVNLESVSKRTESFVAWDLHALVDRAIHAAMSRAELGVCVTPSFPDIVLTDVDFEVALKDFSPIALRDLRLNVKGTTGWSDVGGLSTVKKSLVETLQWPTKYPELFKKCPLPMRSGILLYGPPGTGKTLLATAVASECGMNFISVKGPELLSKYIGASEQAVRQLFLRAESARPCVIFFDEFDSLAPRRGHDSTGVTDRVVNQLLTQMDGVETVQGVYVLAATSRPDLIDPALLRPGRLDKCIYCPLPSETERLEILRALSRSMVLEDDADLGILANKCPFFSGADLKAVLYSAQLNSLYRTQPSSQPEVTVTGNAKRYVILDSTIEDAAAGVCAVVSSQENDDNKLSERERDGKACGPMSVSQMDLMTAVEGTRPSVTATERARYQSIYSRFLKSRGASFEMTAEHSDQTKRATMA